MLKAISNSLQNYALRQTRALLMDKTDRQLEDIGVSRHLLEQGISTWPWREEDVADQPQNMTTAEINVAVQQLSAMTNQELRDMGISRGDIRQAVTGESKDLAA